MSQKSVHDPFQKSPKDQTGPEFVYKKCPLPGHQGYELKFYSKEQYPNITSLYCPMCLNATIFNPSSKKLDVDSLEKALRDAVDLSKQYIEQLEPVMVSFQQKQEQITKNDFKSMFQSVTSRREKFRKIIHNFKVSIASICQKYEEFFEKQLETLFYDRFFSIDTRLSSFKDTFGILRLRLQSYQHEIPKLLATSPDLTQYCQNLTNIFKDAQSLKSSNLVRTMNQLSKEAPAQSQAVEEFLNDCTIEKDLSEAMKVALELLNSRLELLKKSSELKGKNQKTLQSSTTDKGASETHQKVEKADKKEENKTPQPANIKKEEPVNKPIVEEKPTVNKPKEDNNKKEEVKAESAAGGVAAPNKKVWADPADENIEVFEKEIAKFYQGDLIKKLAFTLERQNMINEIMKMEEEANKGIDENGNSNKENTTDQKKQEDKVNQKSEDKQGNKDKLKEEPNGNSNVLRNGQEKRDKEERIEDEKEASSDSQYAIEDSSDEDYLDYEDEEDDGNYEDDEDEKLALQREIIAHLNQRIPPPEILRRPFKPKRHVRRLERCLPQGIMKLSTIIDEDVWPKGANSKSKESISRNISFLTITNKERGGKTTKSQIQISKTSKNPKEAKESKKGAKDKAESKETKKTPPTIEETEKDLADNFLLQLNGSVDQNMSTQLQKMMRPININAMYANKRLKPETIAATQDLVGECLRQSHMKNVLEYRKKRREYNDNEEAVKYNYVCRDFFIKYYHYYKSIKATFLEVLGVERQEFNTHYKYWIENGHSYLAWSRFKSKIQKASIVESKQNLNSAELKGILDKLLCFIKDPLGEFRDDIIKTNKTERYLLIELLLARVYDRAYFAFQIEEEDILASLHRNNAPEDKEAHKLYEEFEKIIASLMYPGMNIKVVPELPNGSK